MSSGFLSSNEEQTYIPNIIGPAKMAKALPSLHSEPGNGSRNQTECHKFCTQSEACNLTTQALSKASGCLDGRTSCAWPALGSNGKLSYHNADTFPGNGSFFHAERQSNIICK